MSSLGPRRATKELYNYHNNVQFRSCCGVRCPHPTEETPFDQATGRYIFLLSIIIRAARQRQWTEQFSWDCYRGYQYNLCASVLMMRNGTLVT